MKKKERAFTLIELLVVIAVIAVLMGIMMPALKKARELAMGTVCQGNMKSYALAVSMYTSDNDDRFPDSGYCYFANPGDTLPGETGNRWTRWCDDGVNLNKYPELGSAFFQGYLMNAKGLICPTFKRLAKNLKSKQGVDDKIRVTNFAREVAVYNPWMNYTQNAYLGPKKGTDKPAAVACMSQVKTPQTVFTFVDEGPFVEEGFNQAGLNDTRLWVFVGTGTARGVLKQANGNKWNVKPGNPQQFADVPAGFHHAPSGNLVAGKGTAAMADGHVEMIRRDDAFGYAWPE